MRRLKAFKGAKGNALTMFAEKYLVKKAYFELSNVTIKFAFLEPGLRVFGGHWRERRRYA